MTLQTIVSWESQGDTLKIALLETEGSTYDILHS